MEAMGVHGDSSGRTNSTPSRPTSRASGSVKKTTSTAKRSRSSTPTRKEKGKARSKEATEEADDDSTPPPQELDELYVTKRTEVVGIQYYAGLVGTGENVMLQRQPENQYDPNAVQVLNAGGTQVGHIPRAVAAHLAPLMDAKLISVEGVMLATNLDGSRRYKLPIDISIYARGSHRPHLEPMLDWATPHGMGFEYMRKMAARGQEQPSGSTGTLGSLNAAAAAAASSSAVDTEMQGILNSLKKVDGNEQASNGVMDALTADMDVAKLPLHPSPPSIASGELLNDLLPHQSQALQWMIQHEHCKLPSKAGDDAVQFWTRQKGKDSQPDYWLNVATKTPQSEKPVLGRGGIVADGMGLGKTLTTLALVLATMKDRVGKEYSGGTLVVCPLSVLSNWEKQIKDHVAPGHLNSYTYHGANRDVTANTLSQYDIVITTYQTIAADISGATTKGKGKKSKNTVGPLMQVKWQRAVADEAHQLKNPKAKMTQAFAALDAERRWALTGTPIVNSPGDLGSLLTCIKVCAPLDNADYFKRLVLRPLKWGGGEAGRLLQAIVRQTLLRRDKDTKDKDGNNIVSLPPIEYYQSVVPLDPETRTLYDEVMAEAGRRFREGMATRESGTNVLSMLTRMRQLCLSADLVPVGYLSELKGDNAAKQPSDAVAIDALSPEQREALIEKLRQAIADQEECSVCYEILNDPRITDCGHPFCLLCITEVIRRQALCPMDRHPLSEGSLLELPPDAANVSDDDDFSDDGEVAPRVRSAKISELVRYLGVFDKNDKTLVFSQFTTFLDRVAAVLHEEGTKFCRFDGSMSAKKRREIITQFQEPLTSSNRKSNPVVMLISLKSGAVGLNLTAANNVFLCDPWWHSAIEAQAVDRVHRMGQRKTVRVFQLIAEDTVESKVLEIQKRKEKLIAQAFEHTGTRENKAAAKQARFEEMKELFGAQVWR